MLLAPQNHHASFAGLRGFKGRLTELSEVYISSGLFHFVNSLTSIFVPLYLMDSAGYSLLQVLIFLMVISATRAVLSYPVAILISKIGPKHAMSIAFPVAFFIFILLLRVADVWWVIVPIVFLEGLLVTLYTSAFHIDLSKGSHPASRGSEISKVYIFNLVALALGPIIGGFIIEDFGFDILIYVSMALLSFAIIPLFASEEIYNRRKFELSYINLQSIKADLAANMASNFEVVGATTVWAIFIFLFLNNYAEVGAAKSLMLFTAAVMTYFAGKVADKYDSKKLLSAGSIAMGVVEAARVFVRTFSAVLTVDFIRGLILPFRTIPYVERYYKHADEEPRMEYIFAMELSAAVSTLILVLFMTFVNLISGSDQASLIFGLIMGSLGAFGIRMIR